MVVLELLDGGDGRVEIRVDMFISESKIWMVYLETLPKALRTQVLTALTSNFGLVGLVQYAW